MSEKKENQPSGRRNFFRLLTAGGAGFVLSPIVASAPVEAAENLPPVKPATNIQDALKFPRNANSMPGLFPGAVTQVNHTGCIKDKVIQQNVVDQMLTAAMLNLTGKKSVKKAWRKFVKPHDIVGLKVNPVAGKLLTTSHELVKAVIAQLETAGIPRNNIVIWDRREMELHETGFLPENYSMRTSILSTSFPDEVDLKLFHGSYEINGPHSVIP